VAIVIAVTAISAVIFSAFLITETLLDYLGVPLVGSVETVLLNFQGDVDYIWPIFPLLYWK
jgi:hypothetical protein